MDLLFDLDLLAPEKMANLSFEEEKVLETIYNFVFERLMVLQDEVDKEDSQPKPIPSSIIIEIKRQRISFNYYSDELTDKLMSCITPGDQLILNNRLKQAFDYLN